MPTTWVKDQGSQRNNSCGHAFPIELLIWQQIYTYNPRDCNESDTTELHHHHHDFEYL